MASASASKPRGSRPWWRSSRGARHGALGVGISSEGVRAVRVRGTDVEWLTEQAIADAGQLDVVLDDVLADAVRSSPRLRGVTVAVGPSCAQLRRLTRLPPVPPGTLEALIQENAARFFLRNGVPVVTTSVERDEDGSFWAGAIEQPVIAAVAAACAKHRLRLSGVVPTAAVLHHALLSDSITWVDGGFAALVEYDRGHVVAYRRVSSDPSVAGTGLTAAELKPPLREVPGAGWRFADAYGAALEGPRPILACHPAAVSARSHPWRSSRFLPGGVACVLALGVAAIAPGVASVRDEHRSRQALAALGPAADEAVLAEHQYAVAYSELHELRRFSSESRPVTLLLASITEALAAPAMLTRIQFDSAGGTLTALAPSASSILQQLEGIHAITDLAIVGPVLPEADFPEAAPQSPDSQKRVVRVTIRYKWSHGQRGPTQ